MNFDRKYTPDHILKQLYKCLLTTRILEEKMSQLVNQGKISKWSDQVGKEALSVGATLAMRSDEWVLPSPGGPGVFIARNIPLHKLLKQWLGDKGGYSKGRTAGFHFATREHFIFGTDSDSGSLLSVGDGVALAYKLRKQNKVALAFINDLATTKGEFHESLNLAAVWELPIIFIIETNTSGLKTTINDPYRWESIAEKAKAYGIEGVRIDGNNVLEVYDTIRGVREYCYRTQRPYVVECATFRMRGNEAMPDFGSVSKEFPEEWLARDPVGNYEEYMAGQNIIPPENAEQLKEELKGYVEEELDTAFNSLPAISNITKEHDSIYAHPAIDQNNAIAKSATKRFQPRRHLSLIASVREALHQTMKQYSNLIVVNEPRDWETPASEITEDLMTDFGKERVRMAPRCTSAIVGTALGLSLEGFKSVIELESTWTISGSIGEIVNNLANAYYYFGQNADVVVRMAVGRKTYETKTLEALFVHSPGLKVVYPSNPVDAKGLLIAAIKDPNPVIFLEDEALYKRIDGSVSEDAYEVELGRAKLVQEGSDISIITYGKCVNWAVDYAKNNRDISLNILDLRTLLPLDYVAIKDSVTRTGKVLILHEDTLTGGIGGEIAAWIGEHCFKLLDAPVMRCASLDTPVPYNDELKQNYLPVSKLESYVQLLLNY